METLKTVHSTTFKISTDYSKESWSATNTIELPSDIDARIEHSERLLLEAETILSVMIKAVSSGKFSFEEAKDNMDLVNAYRLKSTTAMKDYRDDVTTPDYTGMMKYTMRNKIIKSEIADYRKNMEEIYGIEEA